jgi:hypothetical protein
VYDEVGSRARVRVQVQVQPAPVARVPEAVARFEVEFELVLPLLVRRSVVLLVVLVSKELL